MAPFTLWPALFFAMPNTDVNDPRDIAALHSTIRSGCASTGRGRKEEE